MLKRLLSVALMVAVAGCTHPRVKNDDLVVAPYDKIPLKLGLLALNSNHIGGETEQMFNEDRGVVQKQAIELLEAVYERVSGNPRLPDTDVTLRLDYVTTLQGRMAVCRGKAIITKAFSSEPIAEFRAQVRRKGRLSDRLDTIRYNALLGTQKKLIHSMRGDSRLKAFAARIGKAGAAEPKETKIRQTAVEKVKK